MKYRILFLFIFLFFISINSIAFEIYNKDNNKLKVFGSMHGVKYYSKNFHLNGDKSYIGLGIRGETKITNKLIGYAQTEYFLPIKHELFTNSFSKYNESSFVGLIFKDGSSLDYGRSYGIIYDISSWTDVSPEFSIKTYGSDNFMFQRSKGLLTYRNKDFFGLTKKLKIAAQYQFKNNNINEISNYTYLLNQNGSGLGLSAIYNLNDDLVIGTAMFISHRTKDQIEGKNDILGQGNLAKAFIGGFKYHFNNIYLAAMFSKTNSSTRFSSIDSTTYGFVDKAKNFEIITQYQFNFGLRPSLGYIHSRGTKIQLWDKQNLKRYINIGAIYEFNKNIFACIDYQLNLLKKNDFSIAADIDLNNVFALGLVYHF